jgi:hypothetical protein
VVGMNASRKMELSLEIEDLKKNLVAIFAKYKDLRHPEVLHKSEMLDQKIVEYYQHNSKEMK